jgi:hypothetical protein
MIFGGKQHHKVIGKCTHKVPHQYTAYSRWWDKGCPWQWEGGENGKVRKRENE